MSKKPRPSAEEIVQYTKNPATKIATITLNRPDRINAPTSDARLRYADLLHRANVDDDVKVLVIRGVGDDFGGGADLPEWAEVFSDSAEPSAALPTFKIDGDEDVKYPPRDSFRHEALYCQWLSNSQAGCRSLQEFKKISILEVKGYCYGWHFYQAADADLVISSDDALFGHPSFRYVGWGPRMWSWAQTMGIRKFQEMVFTGRPFTAKEMYECNFVNRVVSRGELEGEVEKYALACSRNRPTDTVYMQKTYFEMMKQYQGEYMGSMLTAWLESMGRFVRPDRDDFNLDEKLFNDGLGNAVRSNDEQFPPDFRLSKSGRKSERKRSK
jgi:enoyl-CoA hydratase